MGVPEPLDEGDGEQDGGSNVHEPMQARDVPLGAVRGGVLVIGQPGDDGAEGRQHGEADDPCRRQLEPFDTEGDSQDVEQQRGGRSTDDHVDQDSMQGVTQPRAIE